MSKSGNITLFTALALTAIASFLFVLLEAAHQQGLYVYADSKSSLCLESVAAEYHREIWEQYHLLCLDGSYGEETFSMESVTGTLYQRLYENLMPEQDSSHFFRMTIEDAEPVAYELLTDSDGAVFLSLAVQYMKKAYPLETAKNIYENYKETAQTGENSIDEGAIEAAINAILQAGEETQESENIEMEENIHRIRKSANSDFVDNEAAEENDVENPLEIVKELKNRTFLSIVLGEDAAVSAQGINNAERLQQRTLEKGNMENEYDIGWYEKVLAAEYLAQHFSNYTKETDGHALQYEMEYILCGKENDSENLAAAAQRILWLREAANITHILSDSTKTNEAAKLAMTLSGFTGNGLILKTVELGIIAAWAYMESIQDVRALLCGDKIALVKNSDQWTLDTKDLLHSFESSAKAKNCENGLTYEQYLKQILFMGNWEETAYRAMELIEWNMKQIPAYENCRIDHMICSMEYKMHYEAGTLFAGFFAGGYISEKQFLFVDKKKFSYLN